MTAADRIKVLQVTARFLPQIGGIERHVFEVASRLSGRSIDTAVLTTDAIGDLPPEGTIAMVPVRRVPAWPRGRDYHYAPGIIEAIAGDGWDVVHVQGIHTLVAPMAMAASRRARIPYVVTFHSGGHSSGMRTALRPLQWLALRPWLRGASQLIGVSEFEASAFAHHLRLRRERFVVIANGADAPMEVDRASAPRDPDLIVSVGRLERYKGHHRLVAALPHVIASRPGARLRVVGDGPERARLMALAESLGVGDRVVVGAIAADDRAEMQALLDVAGVVALLSDYEAHPVAVMEALARGCPVVVADTSGLHEIAARGWARAVPPQSGARVVAEALLTAMSADRGVPVDLPTWDETADRLASVYRRAAGTGA